MSLLTGLWRIFERCQAPRTDRKAVEDFVYEQADLLRNGKVTKEQVIDVITERFPEMTPRQVTNALARGLFLSR
ncbi:MULTISPECIES: hypothetical protein [unclassified Micromonospora]|uniref:hypothetical protein n=1 Tax=unclassified Micromonospora TaxID=2617518 RepID=UPI0022B72F02|nr:MULTISPECIES: hypothetical protein [unclassified Micromonospora]MCZ7423636.1 hypothetical protein [Verrucosispora sp. WMMA2121]WBB91327.1 hypothetical protein O7597_30950 [Verrucosispora sp. WMMC514]